MSVAKVAVTARPATNRSVSERPPPPATRPTLCETVNDDNHSNGVRPQRQSWHAVR